MRNEVKIKCPVPKELISREDDLPLGKFKGPCDRTGEQNSSDEVFCPSGMSPVTCIHAFGFRKNTKINRTYIHHSQGASKVTVAPIGVEPSGSVTVVRRQRIHIIETVVARKEKGK